MVGNISCLESDFSRTVYTVNDGTGPPIEAWFWDLGPRDKLAHMHHTVRYDFLGFRSHILAYHNRAHAFVQLSGLIDDDEGKK